MTAKEFYDNQVSILSAQKKQLLTKKNNFAWLRLATIIALVAAVYFTWPYGWIYSAAAVLILLICFVQLIYKDLDNREAIAHNQQLLQINENELLALQHQYFQFASGLDHIPKDHLYANDLDIFGHASLFQFANRTVSEMGSLQLAKWLLHPAPAAEIPERQNAVKELSTKMTWGQKIQAHGKEVRISIRTKNRLEFWLTEPAFFSKFRHWNWLSYALPVISVSITVAFIFGLVSSNVFYANLFLMSLVALPNEKKVNQLHNKLSKMAAELDHLSRSIEAIENEKFLSPYLLTLQEQYKHKSIKASKQIKDLKKILDRLDIRYNIVLIIPLNLLLLWNLQQMMALEKWKEENDADVSNWFDTLGTLEALLSFATLRFNNPAWVFPELKTAHFQIAATNLGHPLIAETKRVNNFIDIRDKGSIMLVTGSNMAGKSTYLRSVGTNIVLSMAGSPVCADTFMLSPVTLISSMRIADNLEESTSTFYAELKKLKAVIDRVNRKEKVFILLDEILRGTNSLDRHTGSKALLKQLIKQDAAAILATHDVDLAALEESYPDNIFNFHFDVQVNKEELYFDYRLKPGVCTSLNASILMKKIGIELEDE